MSYSLVVCLGPNFSLFTSLKRSSKQITDSIRAVYFRSYIMYSKAILKQRPEASLSINEGTCIKDRFASEIERKKL